MHCWKWTLAIVLLGGPVLGCGGSEEALVEVDRPLSAEEIERMKPMMEADQRAREANKRLMQMEEPGGTQPN